MISVGSFVSDIENEIVKEVFVGFGYILCMVIFDGCKILFFSIYTTQVVLNHCVYEHLQ